MKTITIPLQAPSQNDFSKYRDWRARARETKKIRAAWAAACRVAMSSERIDRATGPRKLWIMAYRVRKCRDIANLIGGMKPCIDGLVDAGLLVDDSTEMAEITYNQGVCSESPNGLPCTIISIE